MIRHHSIFDKFTPYQGTVEAGFQPDFVGTMTRTEYVSGAADSPEHVQLDYPPIDEEYFEWIDVLESVVGAEEEYVMVELGAGYGRWAVRAACALRQRFPERPLRLIAAEAHPTHFRWMEEHFRANSLDPSQHRLLNIAVSDRPGSAQFYVGMPPGGKDEPNEWYGQALAGAWETPRERTGQCEGQPVIVHESGWKSIETKVWTLEEIVRGVGLIDLIDFDVQGQELKVIESSLDLLQQRVRRLHIGTHSTEVEEGLRRTLGGLGWSCTADYSLQRKNDTPYGAVDFVDGVQSWVNPRLT